LGQLPRNLTLKDRKDMSSLRRRVLLSLTIEDSVYQRAEAQAAKNSARKHGFDVDVTFAKGDAIAQSDQLLRVIQSSQNRPDAIMLEPVGTGMVRVAQEAAKAGIGWVVVNREVEYIPDLRKAARAPIFAVSTNHTESGRIQGRQLNALLPKGGFVLYLQGPTSHPVVEKRQQGLLETKREEIEVRPLNGHWEESVACDVVSSWLRLPTSRSLQSLVVAAQNDFMAIGARKAFAQLNRRPSSETPVVRYIGCDGLEEQGKSWVQSGLLDGTVCCPSLTALAMDLLAKELKHGVTPQPITLANPVPYPPLEQLRPS
jgi:ribose transport system substrate-binding protein